MLASFARVFTHRRLSTVDRLNGFGFLAGAEVKAGGVGNLGLDDREYPSLIPSQYFEGDAAYSQSP